GQGVVAPARGGDDFLVGDADGLRQRRALAGLAHHRLARERTGDLPILVAAHAVGHQPQAQLAVAVVGVFVELAAEADVREMAELDHARAAAVPLMAERDNGGGWRLRSAGMGLGARGMSSGMVYARRPRGHGRAVRSCRAFSGKRKNAPSGALRESGGEGGIRTPEAL